MVEKEICIREKKHKVSPLLFGLFLEDISFSCDGGLNTNMVNNHSFDGVYMERSYSQMDAVMTKTAPKTVPERLRYWEVTGEKISSMKENPASKKNPWYARVDVKSCCTLRNRGYNGGQANQGECAMSVKNGHTYEISAYLRKLDFEGTISVSVVNEEGELLTDKITLTAESNWAKKEGRLNGLKAGRGMLEIDFIGNGTIDVDCIILSDEDVWGKGDRRWTGGHFRRNMVEALKELNPTFLRFPGGCIVEGAYPGNEYQWKNTVGPVIDRIPEVNLWAETFEEKGYSQSYQIGFYEYFLLCEDLCMEPLPIVWAGLNCQFRSIETLKTDSPEFEEQVVRNALDLIEYANGDPNESEWARLRAAAGHPEPFGMKMIGIGNENYGKDYHEKFGIVKKAVQEKYPDMVCIMASGAFPKGDDFDETWKIAKEKFQDVRIDEHFYKKEEWFYQQVNRYDNYERGTAEVFVGEYACNDLEEPHKPNTYRSALAEAAFLTGIEKNSDVVAMTSYAPLFSMSGGMHWNHNLIWFNPEHIMKTPNYYVQQMFGAHLGESFFDTEGVLPEQVYLSVTGDAKKYYIKLVNAGENAQTVAIEFNEQLETCAQHICMQTDDLECANELSFTGEPIYHICPTYQVTACEDKELICHLEAHSINVYEVTKA